MGGGGAHYISISFKKMFNVHLRSDLTFLGKSGNIKSHEEYSFDGLRTVCKQKTEIMNCTILSTSSTILECLK